MSEELKTPWMKCYGEVPFHLDYPDISMSEAVFRTARKNPDATALSFMGRHTSYHEMTAMIEIVAKSFKAMGIREGEHVTLCLPNVPQAIYCLYALNRIGAIACMIHPLSAVGEIVFYLQETGSRCVVTLDQFYDKFLEVKKQVEIPHLIIASVSDELTAAKAIGYKFINRKQTGRKYAGEAVSWKSFLAAGNNFYEPYFIEKKGKDPAVILFSGGTTGKTKGILLSNLNFNALAMQTIAMFHGEVCGAKMLAAMPVFHGFGLGVCIHTILFGGGISILVPRFTVKEYAKLIKKQRPNLIAGVPTLFEALTRNPYLEGADLSCLRGVFSGGDSLPAELKKRIDKFLFSHGSSVHVREGYGTTECVTASCLTPYHEEREGSIGLPYPDTYYKICRPGTEEEVPYGEDGEICLTGPSVMLGYLNNPEENAEALRTHADGHVWLHTGDMGYMDADGFIYFKQRIKRMIVISGYNVYPTQLENIIDQHDAVHLSCVIGVPDSYKMHKAKAFVVLKDGYKPSEKLKESILEHCSKNIAKYAMPYDIEFRTELPKTLVGKIAYTVLEKEEEEKMAKAAEEQAAKERAAEMARLEKAAAAEEKKSAKKK
ncbi:MAG: class I adenylate-forming enzyme family protein [Oscillospiraceae bacterium]